MLKMSILSCKVAFLMLTVLTARSQRASDQPSVPDPHHHLVPVHQTPWNNDLAPDARFIQITQPLVGHDTTFSPNGRWRAFLKDQQDGQVSRVCLQEVQTGTLYELRGIPLRYRPISNLLWVDDTLFTFDRWSQPHYGIHYVVNAKRLRVVLSTPFPDAFILRKQGVLKDSIEQHLTNPTH